jgi:hypothetical protein
LDDQVLMIVRGQVGGIILGTVFLFVGLAACAIAVIRGGARVRILVWFGIFSAMYGARILAQMPAAFSVFAAFALGQSPLRDMDYHLPGPYSCAPFLAGVKPWKGASFLAGHGYRGVSVRRRAPSALY